jgi:hypothetical protein
MPHPLPASARLRSGLQALRTKILASGFDETVGLVLAAVAILIALGVGLHGIAGLVPAGHFASDAAIGMCGDNMWRWGTALPVVGYQEHPPAAEGSYMHHPLGVFWVVALLGRVFGFHDWILRIPAVAYVALTPWFLYRIGRELWGPIEGGLAALAFVALPITLGYANYHDLEQPVMFGCLVATWGYLRFVRTWRDRYALASVLGFTWALLHDWQAYVWGALLLAGLFVRGYVLPERTLGPVRARAFGRYWALMCGAMAVNLGLELLLLEKSGRLADLIGMFFVRSGGNSAPLGAVLESRRYRIELMFTGLAIFLGKLAVPVIGARAVIKRNDLELLSIPLLLAAVFQYVVFKQGADVHIFWPHSFAVYFGLAVGALAATARDGARWLGKRLDAPWATRLAARAGLVAVVVVLPPVLFILSDGLSLVRLARETGGRFAEANLESDVDKETALRWFLARVPDTAAVAFAPSVPEVWNLQWEARPHPSFGNQPMTGAPPPSVRVAMLDSRATSAADLRAAAGRFHVHAVGPYWLVDRQAPAAPLDGYSFSEREPTLLERWAQGGTEPARSVRPDPWVTWEWRRLLGQAATPPATAPVTLDQVRIAHNAALDRGDAAAAAGLRARLAAAFNLPRTARYTNGTELIGGVHAHGAARSFTLFFVAGKIAGDAKLTLRASALAAPRVSTLPRDPTELDAAASPIWPTSLWRPGHIYSATVVYRKRPGTELFTASWSPPMVRSDSAAPVELARLR